MKNLISIFLLFCCTNIFATNYYVAKEGDDSNTGLNGTTQGWATIAKVNSFSFAANDSILFERGGIFYGGILVTRASLNFGAYGTGAKPVISGLSTLSGWVSLGGNLWEAATSGVSATVNLVLRNNTIQQVGRYPNTDAANSGYLTNTATTSTSITGPALSSVTNWTGAEVAIRVNRWSIVRKVVTGHSAGTISFSALSRTPGVNFGYFFLRDSRTLDKDGEWWHDNANSKLRVYSTTNPSTYIYEISTVDDLFFCAYSNITITNLAFTGAGNRAIRFSGGTNVLVYGVDVTNSGGEGISSNTTDHVTVDNCTVNNCLLSGIRVNSPSSGLKVLTVKNCIVNNISLIAGMEASDGVNGGEGLLCKGGDSVLILNNRVTNTGYNGIEWQGNDAYVKYNYVSTFCSVRDDGSGIYTIEGPGSSLPTRDNRYLISNIVTNGVGAVRGTDGGTSESAISGLYFDQGTRTVVVDSNTVFNVNGNSFHGNSNASLTFINNTFYGNTSSISTQRFADANLVRSMVIKKNIFYPYRFRYRNLAINLPSLLTKQADISAMGVIDSNYYSLRPGIDSSLYAVTTYADRSNYQETVNNFSYIQNTCIQEVNSTRVNPTNIASSLQVNPSASPITYVFTGLSKKDVYGTVYNNSVNIPAWSSVVLIDNGSIINNPPTANAGIDQTITLPTSTTTLSGSGTDGDGTIAGYSWAKMSGPAGTNFVGGNSASIPITNLVQGVYVFQLTVTDNGGAFASDQVTITVNAAPNVPPTANAGPSQNISLPTSTATLTGTGTDTDGTIVSYAWTKDSGPSCTITTPSSSTTGVTGLTAGIYVFRLTVTDNLSLTGFDTMRIFVTSLPNVAPTANAGSNQTITLPTNTVTLTGIGTDVDGVITNYLWTKITVASGGTVASPASSTTAINGLLQGVYQYELTVTDNLGLTGKDTVQITVNSAPNTPPTANAGIDQVLTLPTNTTTLTGSGTDVGGSIIGYQWIKLPSSPHGSNFTTSTNANLPLTNLIQGVYKFSLTVTDNLGSTGTDTVQVTVNPAANIPPTVTITPPTQSVTLPLDSVTVTGSAVDSDGTIISYAWSKISGPTSYQIVTVNSNTTIIRSLVVGTYRFALTATDNQGATGSAVVTITVSPNPTPIPSSSIILWNYKFNLN